MRQLTKSIAAGVGTVALVGGIGAGLAYADTPADDPTTSPSATPTTSATETPMAKPRQARRERLPQPLRTPSSAICRSCAAR